MIFVVLKYIYSSKMFEEWNLLTFTIHENSVSAPVRMEIAFCKKTKDFLFFKKKSRRIWSFKINAEV